MTPSRSKHVTLEQIAKLAGVSVSTASRALSGHPAISRETQDLVHKLALDNEYKSRKRSRGTEHSITVVMAVPANHAYIAEPFQLRLLGGVGTAMREQHIDFGISHRVPNNEKSLAELMGAYPVGGLIFLGQSQYHEALNRFSKQGRAFTVWGAALDNQNYCSIGTDNVFGGYRATSHLARLGRRRIAFLGTSPLLEIEQRLEGYKNALKVHDIPYDPALVLNTTLVYEAGFEGVNDLLDRRIPFDGVVSTSDMVALGAIRALNARGKKVPDDVSVVGYDDIDAASYSNPSLTTIRQDVYKAGQLLLTKVLRQMSGHHSPSERLQTDLIVRGSCGG